MTKKIIYALYQPVHPGFHQASTPHNHAHTQKIEQSYTRSRAQFFVPPQVPRPQNNNRQYFQPPNDGLRTTPNQNIRTYPPQNPLGNINFGHSVKTPQEFNAPSKNSVSNKQVEYCDRLIEESIESVKTERQAHLNAHRKYQLAYHNLKLREEDGCAVDKKSRKYVDDLYGEYIRAFTRFNMAESSRKRSIRHLEAFQNPPPQSSPKNQYIPNKAVEVEANKKIKSVRFPYLIKGEPDVKYNALDVYDPGKVYDSKGRYRSPKLLVFFGDLFGKNTKPG